MKELSATLCVPTSDVQARVEANIKQLRDLNAKRNANKAAAATGELPEALDQFTVGSDYPVFIYRKDGIDALAFLKPALVCWLPTIRAHLFCLLQVLTKQLKRASMLVR